MSIALMTAAWSLDLSPTEKLALLALADWANDDGHCWPSMTKLATKTGLTDRALRACVGRLVEMGHLTRSENPGKGVNYIVHPGTTFRPEGRSPRNETTPTPERRSANTSRNTNIVLREDASAKLPDGVSAELWAEYRAMRKQKRAPMTPKAESLMLAKLGRLVVEGHDPAAVIEQSIAHSWTGLFGLKDARNGNTTGNNGRMGRNGQSVAAQPRYRRQPGWDAYKRLQAELAAGGDPFGEADESAAGCLDAVGYPLALPERH